MTDRFWQRTPAGLFPACLGALGCGLVLSRAAPVLGISAMIGLAWQIAAGLLFLGCLAAYAARLAGQPRAILQDIAAPPTRGAVSAGAMAVLLFAAVLLPYSTQLARAVWFAGLGLHFCAMILVALQLWRERVAISAVTPVLYLPFVGQITAPIAGVPLGEVLLSALILYAVLIPAMVVAVASLGTAVRGPVPLPGRAAQAIHLAPVSLIGSAAAQLERPVLFLVSLGLATLIAALLAIRLRWLTAGGYHPGWAAFTFPTAAFAGLCLLAEERLPGFGAAVLAWPALLAACLVTVFVLVRMLKGWLTRPA